MYVYWIGLLVLEDFLYSWLQPLIKSKIFWAVHVTIILHNKLKIFQWVSGLVFQPLYGLYILFRLPY